MTYKTFEEFLAKGTGVTTKLCQHAFAFDSDAPHSRRYDSPRRMVSPSSLFFQPFKSKSDVLISISSIITGPLLCSVTAIMTAATAILYALDSLVELIIMFDLEKARESIEISAVALLMTIVGVIGAILSPIINTIDFIGSVVASLPQDASEEENNPSAHIMCNMSPGQL